MLSKAKKFNIAVIGATGNVGRRVINILEERNFPIAKIAAFASAKSVGKKISYKEDEIVCEALANIKPHEYDIFFMAAGSEVSKQHTKEFAKYGFVIDKSSYFRMNSDVELIVPEINANLITKNSRVVSCPNCVAIPLSIALKPLMKFSKIKRVVVTSLQSVSGAGKNGNDELYNQTKGKYFNEPLKTNAFSRQIAFNLIPAIGNFIESGYTSEEDKITNEVSKILGEQINLTVTSVRVPVFVGHSQSVNVEFEDQIDIKVIEKHINSFPSLLYKREPLDFMTPVDIVGADEVGISRLRIDNSKKNALNFWLVSDNLNKGAALNAVQIAETVAKIADE